jgi:pimeloyl-ACP methyl ester carboxylesterase
VAGNVSRDGRAACTSRAAQYSGIEELSRMSDGGEDIAITTADAVLQGDLEVPDGAIGLIVFAHGSGSSRFSPRNREVARRLRDAGLATLLFDLLTPAEERIDRVTAQLRFDIPLLARRLVGALEDISDRDVVARLPIGCFGASTGAAAALIAAADAPDLVASVVSRGGRPDLAGPALESVRAPTLLIVGGFDVQVIDLNRWAMAHMTCEVELSIVPGAGHLFEQPGTLAEVGDRAATWFEKTLGFRVGP